MTQEGFKRKLTAILSADVVGYSRLMDDNEEATIQTLNDYRKSMTELTDPTVQRSRCGCYWRQPSG
jgi:adenylate cyclase